MWNAFSVLFAPILCLRVVVVELVGFNFRSISDIRNFLPVNKFIFRKKKSL